MKSKVSFLIPARNEETAILKTLAAVSRVSRTSEAFEQYECVVVDDGSTDDTHLSLSNVNSSKIITYRKTISQGKGSALKTAYKMIADDSDYIVFLDADLQINPQDINVFFRLMHTYNADVVIGSKRHPYSCVNYSLTRSLISKGYRSLIQLLFQLSLQDTQCGFKLFKREVLDKIMPYILAKQYAFDLEILVALRDNQIRVIDAPVYVKSVVGKGSVSLKTILATFIDTIAVKYRQVKKWYKIKK